MKTIQKDMALDWLTSRGALTKDGVEAFTQELKRSSTFSNGYANEIDGVKREFG